MANIVRFAPAALLGVGCVLISGIRGQQRVPPSRPLATLQVNVPGYVARDTTVDVAEQKVAGMSHYLSRLYQRGPDSPGFGVYVGYYDMQVQGKSIHSPKNCLPGAGWEPLDVGVRTIAVPGGGSVRVNRFLLANKGAQAVVYYWYEGRGRVEPSEYVVKWNLIRDAARYGRTEEALVRIVVPIDMRGLQPGQRPNYDPADQLATTVAAQLVPGVKNVLPAPPNA
ncbi:EpsI family protein [Gemmatimonadetes bacterium T265]|nr:EpsI family protein [Gemmatimonadetes bacterium T265]